VKITFEDYKKIQELKRQGFTANQATKKLPYTQYKIYKYWDMAEEDFFEETNADNSPCSVYREFLMEEIWKNNNAGARILYDKVFEEFGEVKVSLASLFRYLKGLRRRMGLSEKIVRVKQAVEMQPQGLEAQVDFGQAKILNIYGLPVKVYFFCMVLSYSRMKFVYFSPDPFDALHTAYAHEKAFKYYGGRPKQILYDQDCTIVSSENAGNIIFTKDFDGYVKAAGFDAIVCKPYSPDTKGKVETVVKTVKEYFLERIEITKPRYLKEQAGLLRRIEKEYTQSEILNAVIKCAKEDRYCMTEVLSELLIHLGERNLEEIAPKGAITHYKNLAKYNVLTEVKRD